MVVHPKGWECILIKLMSSVACSLLFTGVAVAQPVPSSSGAPVNLCAANAAGKDGKPLVGAARDLFMRKCEADNRYPKPVDPTPAACDAKAIGKDGKPLAGAAKDAFVKRCVIDTKAVQ